jgi:hypothetical protein
MGERQCLCVSVYRPVLVPIPMLVLLSVPVSIVESFLARLIPSKVLTGCDGAEMVGRLWVVVAGAQGCLGVDWRRGE